METLTNEEFTIFYEPQERSTAEQILQACERCSDILGKNWALKVPANCRLFVMTSWKDFMFQSSTGSRRRLLKLTYPFWAKRVHQMWETTGGWNLPSKEGPLIGIKSAHLIQLGDPEISKQIFIDEADPYRKVQQVTCHELTHAFTSHLKFPMWLREGLAMLVADRFFERPTVKWESLDLLKGEYQQFEPEEYKDIKDDDFVAFLYGRGYWLTRYLAEKKPEILREILQDQHENPELEAKIAVALGIDPEDLWDEVNSFLLDYYRPVKAPANQSA